MFKPKGLPSSSLVYSNPVVCSQPLDCGASTMDHSNGGNNVNNNPSLASKQRLRWTHELHERFIDAVAQLGGPDRKLYLFSIFLCSCNSYPPLGKKNSSK